MHGVSPRAPMVVLGLSPVLVAPWAGPVHAAPRGSRRSPRRTLRRRRRPADRRALPRHGVPCGATSREWSPSSTRPPSCRLETSWSSTSACSGPRLGRAVLPGHRGRAGRRGDRGGVPRPGARVLLRAVHGQCHGHEYVRRDVRGFGRACRRRPPCRRAGAPAAARAALRPARPRHDRGSGLHRVPDRRRAGASSGVSACPGAVKRGRRGRWNCGRRRHRPRPHRIRPVRPRRTRPCDP